MSASFYLRALRLFKELVNASHFRIGPLSFSGSDFWLFVGYLSIFLRMLMASLRMLDGLDFHGLHIGSFIGFSQEFGSRFNNTKMGKKFPSMKLIRLIDISTRRKENSLDERSCHPSNSIDRASQEFFLI